MLEQFCTSPSVPSLLSHISIILRLWPLLSQNRFQLRRQGWRITFALDAGGIPGNGERESVNGDSPPGVGETRLGKIVTSAGGRQLLEKLNSARKNFPMKIFLLLLGFYTANALATILGQTGDRDLLFAGGVVAAIEGIGMLMYVQKAPFAIYREVAIFCSNDELLESRCVLSPLCGCI